MFCPQVGKESAQMATGRCLARDAAWLVARPATQSYGTSLSRAPMMPFALRTACVAA
jgi:hypothetical protein